MYSNIKIHLIQHKMQRWKQQPTDAIVYITHTHNQIIRQRICTGPNKGWTSRHKPSLVVTRTMGPTWKTKGRTLFQNPRVSRSPPPHFYCQDSEFSLKRQRKARRERKQSSLSTPKAQINIFPISASLLYIFLPFSPIFNHSFLSSFEPDREIRNRNLGSLVLKSKRFSPL